MSFALWSIFIGSLIPLFFTGYAKFSKAGYDNRQPRDFLAKLDGQAKRAHWSCQNFYETFPLYIGAILLAHLREVPTAQINAAAAGYLACRILYGFAYMNDWDRFRSLCWFMAYICIFLCFFWAR